MLQLKKYPYSGILGWSASRYDKFKTCKRQYYFEYYAKNYDNEIDKNHLLRLKALTSIPLEIGNIVHDIIKIILERLAKDSSALNIEKLKSYSEKLALEYINAKEFSEVFYNDLIEINKSEITDKVLSYIDLLINSERFKWILDYATPQSNNWLVEPEGFGETRINNIKAYCKVDFLFPVENKIYIVDWKTGKEDELKQEKQLKGYTAFACDHFGKKAEDVVCILYFVKESKEKVFHFSAEEITQFSQSIKLQTEEMYGFNSNIDNNIPLPKSEFKKTASEAVCHFCNYRDICLDKKNI